MSSFEVWTVTIQLWIMICLILIVFGVFEVWGALIRIARAIESQTVDKGRG